jgi:sugar/nucleoside kinase (ribokinase family)
MDQAEIDVLGIGNAIVDVFGRVDDDFLEVRKLTKGAMRLIEEPEAHELYDEMGPALQVSGGSAANTIAGVASFGGKAAYFGKVKADQLGEIFSHDLKAQGVRFETRPALDGPSTGRSLILVTPDGERTMNTFLGASNHLTPADVDAKIVKSAGITYMEGYLWDRPSAREAFKLAARLAHAADRQTALTLSDSFCVERHRGSFLELIRGGIDILFANEKEITWLYQVRDFDEALQLVRKDCEIAALTRSEAGCVIVRGDEVHVVPAHRVPKVVDATGAGDLFASGFLFGYTQGKGLADCGRLGALAAAEVISHVGARPEVDLSAHARQHGLL